MGRLRTGGFRFGNRESRWGSAPHTNGTNWADSGLAAFAQGIYILGRPPRGRKDAARRHPNWERGITRTKSHHNCDTDGLPHSSSRSLPASSRSTHRRNRSCSFIARSLAASPQTRLPGGAGSIRRFSARHLMTRVARADEDPIVRSAALIEGMRGQTRRRPTRRSQCVVRRPRLKSRFRSPARR